MEVRLKAILTSFRKVKRSGSSNMISLPKYWASVGEVIIVVVQDDDTVILKRNATLKIEDV